MWPKNDAFCCDNLRRSLAEVPNSTFAVQENGVAYLSVGYVQIDDGGIGWFDQALLFCPFCGIELQTIAEIKKKVDD
ncbi:hypothetical protein [Aestuariivirga sp.]|uniref:hypothetical protein n=1 Tax=Aestuariivirga sp. TaxID=2650926 RepID=UPI003BA8A3B0